MTIQLPEPYPGTVAPAAAARPAAVPTSTPHSRISPTSVALALASPAVTGAMLALARHWSDHGARHSIGDMMPLAAGAILGAALTCWASATEDPLLVGTCGALTAATLGIGMMAYPTGLAEPLIAAGIATMTGWVLTRRVWRERAARHEQYAEADRERDHQTGIATVAGQTAIGVATITAQGQIETARVEALGALAVANARVDAIEYDLWRTERDTRRAQALTVSPTAAGMLAAAAPRAIGAAPANVANDDLFDVAAAVLSPAGGHGRRSA